MAGSSAEREIRDAVVARLRKIFPDGRIVHELNTRGQGSSRIDVASITENKIIAVEIKSEKDKLDRLGHQIDDFSRCSDWLIVAAHRKHFVDHREAYWRDAVPTRLRLNHEKGERLSQYSVPADVWCFPDAEDGRVAGRLKGACVWPLDRAFYDLRVGPAPGDLLSLLWADELRSECACHGIGGGARRTILDMVVDMCAKMTGREIRHAVCRQLRARPFAEADDPVPLGAAWKVASHG
jgi:hypothetical protein